MNDGLGPLEAHKCSTPEPVWKHHSTYRGNGV